MFGGWVVIVCVTVLCSSGAIAYLSDTPASSNLAVVSQDSTYDGSSKAIGDDFYTPVSPEHKQGISSSDSYDIGMSNSPSDLSSSELQNLEEEESLPSLTTRETLGNGISHGVEENVTTLPPSFPTVISSSVPETTTPLPSTPTFSNVSLDDVKTLPTNTSLSNLLPFLDGISDIEENDTTFTTTDPTAILEPLEGISDSLLNKSVGANDSSAPVSSSVETPIVETTVSVVPNANDTEQPFPGLTATTNVFLPEISGENISSTSTNTTLSTISTPEQIHTTTTATLPSTMSNVTNAKEESDAKAAYIPPTVTHKSLTSTRSPPHHAVSKLTPSPDFIPPQPSPYNWYLLILNGNCSSVMRRERRFEVYVRANLAEKVSVEFSDVLVTSVTCNTVLFVNVTVFGDNQECINRTIFDLASTHALLVEFSGQMYNLTTVRTKTSMFGRKHYRPVQSYENISMEVMIYLAIGAVCLFIIFSALLIALMLCCKKSKKAKRDYTKPNSPWYVQIENYNMTKIPRPNSVYSDTSRSRTPRPNLFSAQKPSRYSDSSSTPLANDDSALAAPDDKRSSTVTNRSSLTGAPSQDDYRLLPNQQPVAVAQRPKKSVEFAPLDDHTVPCDKMTPLSNQNKWGSLDGYDNFSYASL